MIWWNIAYAFVLMMSSYAISYYMASRANKSQNAQVGALDVPTAEAGKTIPVIFGTMLVKDVNVIDYFDAKVQDIYPERGGKK